jgi:ATP synthase protein I
VDSEQVSTTEVESGEAEKVRVWSAEEVQALKKSLPELDLWRVWRWQAVAGLIVVALALAFGSASARVSAVYGVLAVLLPSVVLIRGFTRFEAAKALNPRGLVAGLGLGWLMGLELIKVALTVLLLALAPKVLMGLTQLPVHWPVLVAAFVATLKVYWLALLVLGSKTRAG